MNSSAHHTNTIREHSGDPGLYLEICRGRTEHRVRPILGTGGIENHHEKFLIGGDDDCDLQLGGDDMPALHSFLHFDRDDLWIEAIADEPPLMVNHQAVRACLLCDGDRLEIGFFELAVHLNQEPRQLEVANGPREFQAQPPQLDFDAGFDPERLGERSAEELVDALDNEMQMVERFERRQKLGADALLGAVLAHRQQSAKHVESGTDASRSDLDRTLEQLNGTIAHLERRAQSLERRESAYTEAAATLLEAQERMAAQLDAIERQLAEWRAASATDDRRHRVSA